MPAQPTPPLVSTADSRASTPQSMSVPGQDARRSVKVNTVVNTPYFTPGQFDRLLARARQNKMPPVRWEQGKMLACSFIAAAGAKLGIPQRTIGSAQLLYQRFHLFYPPADFAVHEVALACLFAASKLNDTPKRIHDLLLTSYALRYPELLAPPSGADSAMDWVAHAHLGEGDVDAESLAQERARLLTLERLLLQCICFQFEMRSTRILRTTVKIARHWQLAKAPSALAWRVACDSHRTPAPLLYPPQAVAAGCVYAAAILYEACGEPAEVLRHFASPGAWPSLRTCAADAEDVAYHVFSLYTAHASSLGETGRGPLPAYVSYPPPLGLLAWRALRLEKTLPTSPADLDALLTQAKIKLRHDEQARAEPERVQRQRAVARAQDALAPTMYRAELLGQQMVATRYLLE